MARKKKDSLGLFEVIGKARAESNKVEVRLPGWMDKRPIKLGQPAEPEGAEPPAEPVEPTSAKPAQVVRTPVAAAEPIITTGDGRLRVSLNYVSCGVALIAVLLLLVVAFCLGRASAPSGDGPAVASPAAGQGRKGEAGTPPGRDDRLPTRKSGMHYLVIQPMNGLAAADLADAHKIVKYCSEAGLKASVGKFPSGKPVRYVVWSLEGFESPDSQAASEYAADVDGVGKRYKQAFKTYDFSQFDGSGKLNPWFEQQP